MEEAYIRHSVHRKIVLVGDEGMFRRCYLYKDAKELIVEGRLGRG